MDNSFGVSEAVVLKMNAFGGEKAEFFGECGAGGAALEAAGGEVRGDDAMAGDLWGEGVGAEGLPDGSW